MERKEITLPQPLLHHCTISSGLFHYLNNFCFPITLQRSSKDENQTSASYSCSPRYQLRALLTCTAWAIVLL